jgi:hypothetical protein
MPGSAWNGGRFEVHCSKANARNLTQIQKRAKEQGRGAEALSAIRAILHRLSFEADEFGEPLYRLPDLRLQVRQAAIGPLLIYFGVREDRPLVFIKGVKLLPGEKK